MSWGRLDDRANANAKLLALSDSAFRMWACGLIFCQANLTDGFIPEHAIETFGVRAKNKRAVADELCLAIAPGKNSCWHRVEGGYQVHDYLDWNDSRDKVLKERSLASARVDRFRNKRRTNGARNALQSQLQTTHKPHDERMPTTTGTPPVSPPLHQGISADSLAMFERVYAAYPNKDRKNLANEAWIDLNPPPELAATILADVKRRVKAGWVKFERRFIPQLRNYLLERLWEDATTEAAAPFEDDPYANLPHAWSCAKCGEVHEGTHEQARTKPCLRVTA